ncbi:MAG: outer membrane beta-barrel family protein [Muribaculaceae bacterium]|nr:outer membrane beta-barrel family protein [Muribaculaceae bacterium]
MRQFLIINIALSLPFLITAQTKTAGTLSDSTLSNDTVRLQEVVVKAPTLKTIMEVDGNLTTIKDTELSKLATTYEVMRFIPGLIVSGESVEVAGVGAPEIYIDKKKVRDSNEIKLLSPERIKSIKVIDSPGAKYGGDVRAVILITTYRKPGEGLAVSERLTLGYGDYFEPSNQLSLNYRSGNLDMFASANYSHSATKHTNSVSTELFTPSGSLQSENSTRSKSHSDRWEGKIGFNLSPAADHLFGAYYQGILQKNSGNTGSGIFNNLMNGISMSAASYRGDASSRSPRHRVNAFYAGKWGEWDCDINFDFLLRYSKSQRESHYMYTDKEISLYSQRSENRNRLFAGKIDMSRKLGGGTIYMGTEITNTGILSDFLNYEEIIPSNTTNMNESNMGIYIEYSRKIGIISLYGGIRYEYTWAKYRETQGEGTAVRRDYHELIPSLSVRIPWKEVTLRLSYSRMYNKPIYAWLTNRINYVNPNLYEAGNMYLKPAYFNFYNISCKYRWLMLSLRYGYITGKVMTATIPYPDNPDIILDYKINSSIPLKQFSAVATITPGFIGTIYYPVFSAMIFPQDYRIDFCGKPKRFINPMGKIDFNNLFKFSKSFNATLNFSWSSGGDVEAGHLNGNWRLDAGITKTLGHHWNVQLNVEDIFNTSGTLNATTYTSQSITEGEWVSSNRTLRLTVTYQFNVRRSRYKASVAGESEMERL